MSEANRRPSELEEALAKLSDSWMGLFQPVTVPTSDSPNDVAADFLKVQQNALRLAASFGEPLRIFVESQRELAQQVSQWAQSQSELARTAAAWAESQRKFSDALNTWAGFGVTPAHGGQPDDADEQPDSPEG